LPLFLLWLQISWTVLLFGAEVAYSHQNAASFEFETVSDEVSPIYKKWVALGVARLCVERFQKGQTPLTEEDLIEEMDAPARLISDIIFQLTEAGVLIEVRGNAPSNQDAAYQPARNVDDLTMVDVLTRLDHFGVTDVPMKDDESMQTLRDKLIEMEDHARRSPANLPLKDV
jgi:membrane protein